MKKFSKTFIDICKKWYVKYVLVVVIGVVAVGFLGENSVWAHMRYKQRIADLKEEIAEYESVNQSNQIQIRELQHNPKAMEKIARERYFMKADDEDIFVLSDDESTTQPKTTGDETVE